jgi:tetratricopeptide (TPR) repeat protein
LLLFFKKRSHEDRFSYEYPYYKSVGVARRVLVKNPNDIKALRTIAFDQSNKAGKNINMWKECAKSWENVVRIGKENDEYDMMDYAQALMKSGEYQKSKEIYKKVSKSGDRISSLAKMLLEVMEIGQ